MNVYKLEKTLSQSDERKRKLFTRKQKTIQQKKTIYKKTENNSTKCVNF